MPKGEKYSAKQVYYCLQTRTVLNSRDVELYRVNGRLKLPSHINRFDSQHEFKVYLELVRIYGVRRILFQVPVRIVPPSLCYPDGKSWRVDFAITKYPDIQTNMFLIEAKGLITSEFAYTLTLLEQNNSESFDKLRIIFSTKIPYRNQIINALAKTDYAKNLFTLKNLKQCKRIR